MKIKIICLFTVQRIEEKLQQSVVDEVKSVFFCFQLVVYFLHEVIYVKRFGDKIICPIISNGSCSTGMGGKHDDREYDLVDLLDFNCLQIALPS